jgi:catechol 2,3-dioxygenase-like lactoylglutathione lyase family enzyme
MVDRGLTHIALPVSDLAASIAFYERYAAMQVVHDRVDPATGGRVSWLSDRTRPFVIVLIETERVEHPLVPIAHLGVGCASREDVDRLAAEAVAEGRPVWGPTDSSAPVGYWVLISDPDHHTLELSHGQEIGIAVEAAPRP